MIVTNGTISKRFDEFISFPHELKDRLFFKFSYHFLELKKRNLLDIFFTNIRKVSDAGCSFTLELTPSDDAIPYIDDIKATALRELGALNHVTIARDESTEDKLPMMTTLSREEYVNTWGQFNSKLFDFKIELFGVKRKEFCYAGDWSFWLNLMTGETKQCYKTIYKTNIFKNINAPIRFRAIGCNCRELHCYNGHSYIALGDIPELQSPTYAVCRNRVTIDGKEWLTPTVKSFMNTKLYESNQEYNWWKKWSTNTIMKILGTQFIIIRFLKKLFHVNRT